MKKQNIKNFILGFTLIELVLTIALLIVLSAISVPIYKGYMTQTKIAEGYALLARIRDAQKLYHAKYGTFLYFRQGSCGSTAGHTANDEVLGVDARANKYWTMFNIGYYADKNRVEMTAPFPDRAVAAAIGGNYLVLKYNLKTGQTWTNRL